MPYRKIEFRAGEHYHVYNRGNNFQGIFFERENYSYFLRLLCEHLTAEAVDIVAYCLMPNHYHLLVCLKVDNLSNFMQPFGLAYTKAINRRYHRVGSLFQGPFKAVRVDRDEYALHLSRYIHLNPVSARLVERPEDWEFSSYREFIGLRHGTLPKPDIILSQFPSPDAYRRFVESYTESDRDFIKRFLSDQKPGF
ncbi:MAG TPA: transposase [Anaerolineae bacterium]